MAEQKLTHIDENGEARMVDVGDKEITTRIAIARGEIVMERSTLELLKTGTNKKGDYKAVSKIAGIMAAKKTSELIPLCHPLNINKVDVDLEIDEELPGIQIRSLVRVDGKTGVEMEALTAVSVCALVIYDMVKAVDKKMIIQNIRLVEKQGGKSGHFYNP
jgi:cyclic pyranopterin phosphate synthase